MCSETKWRKNNTNNEIKWKKCTAETKKNLSFDNCYCKMCMNGTKWDFFLSLDLCSSLHLLLGLVFRSAIKSYIIRILDASECIVFSIVHSRVNLRGFWFLTVHCCCSVCARIIAFTIHSMRWYEFSFDFFVSNVTGC